MKMPEGPHSVLIFQTKLWGPCQVFYTHLHPTYLIMHINSVFVCVCVQTYKRELRQCIPIAKFWSLRTSGYVWQVELRYIKTPL